MQSYVTRPVEMLIRLQPLGGIKVMKVTRVLGGPGALLQWPLEHPFGSLKVWSTVKKRLG